MPSDRLRLINTGSRGGTVNERRRRIVTSIISGLLVFGILVLLYFTRHYHIRDLFKKYGHNFQTGEALMISARRVVTFHPSVFFKTEINSVPGEGQDAVTRAGEDRAAEGEGLSGRPRPLIIELASYA